MLHPGLYEQVINSTLNSELSTIPEARKAIAPIDKAEASKMLAQYLADVVQKALDNVIDNGGDVSAQIALTNQIVDLIPVCRETRLPHNVQPGFQGILGKTAEKTSKEKTPSISNWPAFSNSWQQT